MNKLQELEEQLSAIQAQIDEMKKVDEEWPKFGDAVWTIGMEGKPVSTKFAGTPMWRYKLATGSLHRTESEAAAYRDWLTSPRTQARRMVEMCEGYNPCGTGAIITWRHDLGEIKVNEGIQATAYLGGIVFNTTQQAYAAIYKLGEETIKLALGVE